MKLIRYQGIIAILIGLVLIFFTLHIREAKVEKTGLLNTSMLWLQTLGAALSTFGLFTIIVDSHSWRNYFGERLKEIVLEQSYLSNLDTETLRSLQVKVMRSLFKDPRRLSEN